MTFQIKSYKESVIVGPGGKPVRIGSRKDEKAMGVCRYEEVKDRVKDARRNLRKPYKLSEDTKKLHRHMISEGITWRMVEKHMPMYAEKRLAEKEGRLPKWEKRRKR